jgi:hypothetical protein
MKVINVRIAKAVMWQMVKLVTVHGEAVDCLLTSTPQSSSSRVIL